MFWISVVPLLVVVRVLPWIRRYYAHDLIDLSRVDLRQPRRGKLIVFPSSTHLAFQGVMAIALGPAVRQLTSRHSVVAAAKSCSYFACSSSSSPF